MHLTTLQWEHTALLAVYTLLLLAYARLYRGTRGLAAFLLYSVLALCGALSMAFATPLHLAPLAAAGNLLVLGAYAALYRSVDQLFGFGSGPNRFAALWFLLGTAGVLWFAATSGNATGRLLAYSLAQAALQLQLAFLLATDTARRRFGWMLGLTLGALAATNLFRIAYLLHGGTPSPSHASGEALAGVVLANTCLQCGIMFSYLWIAGAMLRHHLEQQATTDPLTGVLNRRALEDAGERAAGVCATSGGTFALVSLDLDGFKPINDRFGHGAGDRTLVAVAACLRRELRTCDLLTRRGGDEFIVLLPRTGLPAALDIAERLRRGLESLSLPLAGPEARVTGSFGVAAILPGERWDDLLARCDGALYTGKRCGGNVVLPAGTAGADLAPQPSLAVC